MFSIRINDKLSADAIVGLAEWRTRHGLPINETFQCPSCGHVGRVNRKGWTGPVIAVCSKCEHETKVPTLVSRCKVEILRPESWNFEPVFVPPANWIVVANAGKLEKIKGRIAVDNLGPPLE